MTGTGGTSAASRIAAWWRESKIAQTMTYVLVDAVVILVAVVAAYAARFEGAVPHEWASGTPISLLAALGIFVAFFFAFGLYGILLKYVGVDAMVRLGLAVASGTLLLLLGDLVWIGPGATRIAPLSVVVLTAVFTFMGAATIRSLGRLQAYMGAGTRGDGARVLIVGAGDAGSLLLRDIENQPRLRYRVVGFVDDDRRKVGRFVRGVRVLDSIDAIPRLVEEQQIAEVFVAMPAASVGELRRVLDLCNSVNVATRVVPAAVLAQGDIGVSQLRQVSIEDLLGRDPVAIDVAGIAKTLAGRSVAVTGAAGSIGSELCRQIMLMHPRELHLLEIDETRLYELFLELRLSDADIPRMQICDVRDAGKVARILTENRVDVVFHAAAYKHVPLMELSPDEAVGTNVGGTRAVLSAALSAGVGHFVLISTDKAVRPSSVMGTTKALAERLAALYARKGLCVSTVRFGNVLGSRGSVVPLFEEQLRRGGPVRVTHPDVTRYFMTIPEAARLVLQAQALSDGGELFVLEMGEPLRILDLARKMITLSGARAEIVFDGLRPGEKLHEVLTHGDHQLVATGCAKILRLNALPLVATDFEYRVGALIDSARSAALPDTVAALAALVPDYTPSVAEDGRAAAAVAPLAG